MAIQDRVILLQSVKNGDTIIQKGTIGTIREDLNGNILIQYGFDGERPIYGIIPTTILRKATIEDIEKVEDYRFLINKQFHLGKKYAISNIVGDNSNQKIGFIKSIDLAINEQFDTFQLAFEDGSLEEYPYTILAYHSSYVEYELEEFKSELIKTNREVRSFEEKKYKEDDEDGNR